MLHAHAGSQGAERGLLASRGVRHEHRVSALLTNRVPYSVGAKSHVPYSPALAQPAARPHASQQMPLSLPVSAD